MSEQRFPDKLIPPSIDDDRTRQLWHGFNAMVAELDFTDLLARTSAEMSEQMLPLAIADRSLEEFIGVDGLPQKAVQNLIDTSFDIHDRKGTDPGVEYALQLIGVDIDIEQWHEIEPPNPHDTHKATVYVNEHIFDDEPTLLNERVQRAALKIIDATKRWSQETNFQIGAGFDNEQYLASGSTHIGFAQGDFDAGPTTDLANPIAPIDCTTAIQFKQNPMSAQPNLGLLSSAKAASCNTAIQFQHLSMEAA